MFKSRVPALFGASAITLYPFVFCEQSEEAALATHTVQHEMVHVEQVRRLGWVGMYGSYVFEYLRHRRSGKSHNESYFALQLEREAYAREGEPSLLAAYEQEKVS